MRQQLNKTINILSGLTDKVIYLKNKSDTFLDQQGFAEISGRLQQLQQNIENIQNGGSLKIYKCAVVHDGDIVTWDGYKASWVNIEGIPNSIKIEVPIFINSKNNLELDFSGVYVLEDDTKTGIYRKWVKDTDNNYYIAGVTYGTINNASWRILYNNNSYYYIDSVSADITIEDLCEAEWKVDAMWSMQGVSIPEITSISLNAGSVGWVFSDELTTGLIAKGYIPEVGRIYLEDTTFDATLYPDEVGGGSSDSIVYDSIRVSDGNNVDYICFGLYTPKDPMATGGNRVWELVDGSGNNMTISYDAAVWKAWVIKSGSTYIFKIDVPVAIPAGASIEEICAGTVSSTGNGSEPYPKLTPAVSPESDSGNSGTVTLPGLSMDVPSGTQNCVILVSYSGLTGSYPVMAMAFSPRSMTDTGTARKWEAYCLQGKYTITYVNNAWRILNPVNGDDSNGDDSADPWNCNWTHALATGATVNVVAFIAI